MSSEDSMMRHGSSSSPATLPDNDDLLREIFLRLPPRPSSLPRASLVCKRWGRLVSDPQFLRRFSAFHGSRQQQPPLLGFFVDDQHGHPSFTPTLDPPDRVPSARLSLQSPCRGDLCYFLGYRHGLALVINKTRHHITLWDPVDGNQRQVAVPQKRTRAWMSAMLLCSATATTPARHRSTPSRWSFFELMTCGLMLHLGRSPPSTIPQQACGATSSPHRSRHRF